MKNQALKSLIILTSLLLAAPITNAGTETNSAHKNEAYLFIQQAPKANLKLNKKDGTYELTLHEVAPTLNYFSERPTRKAGVMPMQDFLNLWFHKRVNNFTVNPPNADLNALQEGVISASSTLNYAIVLSNPRYNSENRTLTYTVSPLSGGAPIPENIDLEHIALFIDDVCLSCW